MEALSLFLLMILIVALIFIIAITNRLREVVRTLETVKYDLRGVKEKLNTLLGIPGGVKAPPKPPVALEKTTTTPIEEAVVTPAPPVKAVTPPPVAIANKLPVKVEPLKNDDNSFGTRTGEILRKIWNYIIVGEEFRNKSLSAEYAVATTWLIRGGTLVLIFGLIYFLKYSIERGLVTPMMRVCLSTICGVAMTGIGFYGLGKKYHIASTALLSIGLISLYLTGYYAYKWYDILTETQALTVMISVCALSIGVAWWKRIFAAALFGMIGGYLVYSLAWVENPNYLYAVLYFTGINFVVMAVKRQYSWTVINFLTLVFYIVFSSVLCINKENYVAILAIMGVNYLLFSMMPLGKKERGDNIFEIVIVLINLWHYFLFSFHYLNLFVPKSYKIPALLALTLATANFFQYLCARKQREGEAQLMYAYCGIAIALLGFSVPMFFEPKFVVAGIWAALGFAMIFAAGKKGEKLFYIAAFALYLASLIQIIVGDLLAGYCLTDRILSTGVLIVSLLGAGELQKWRGKRWNFLTVSGFVLLFIYSSSEIFIQADNYLYGFRHGILSVWWAAWGVFMLGGGIVKRIGVLRKLGLVLLFICIVKVFILDLSRLATLWRTVAFIGLGALLFASALIYIKFKRFFEADAPEEGN